MGKIFCLLNNKNPAAKLSCQKALSYHNGWQKKSYDDDFVSLGIFEAPQKSKDKFWYEDSELVALMDGEINSYAHNADRISLGMAGLADCYRNLGAGFVNYLNGQFTIIFWIKKEKKLIVLNDRLGLRPLYYSRLKDKLILSSEVKGIIADSEFIKALDIESLVDFFTGIPKSLKSGRWLYKKIFIEYFPRLARIPEANKGGLALNANRLEKIIYKGTTGVKNRLFKNNLLKRERRTWDYNKYYRKQLRNFVCSILLSKEFSNRNIFNYKNVERLINAHFNNLSNYEKQVGMLLTFELWSQMFFDRN